MDRKTLYFYLVVCLTQSPEQGIYLPSSSHIVTKGNRSESTTFRVYADKICEFFSLSDTEQEAIHFIENDVFIFCPWLPA